MRSAIACILVLAAMVSTAASATAVEWEPDAKQLCKGSQISNCDGVAEEIIAAVKLEGYRCDSVSSLRKWTFSRGFTMKCNNFAYEYEFEDHGGRWRVKVKD